MNEPLLQVTDLKQYFPISRSYTVKAVNGVSFCIYPGETYGLVGESGSGKTTIGRSIIRLYTPTSGSVRFQGKEIGGRLDASTREMLRADMQMIFQDPMASLNPRKKVEDIIAEGLDIHHRAAGRQERSELVGELLKKFRRDRDIPADLKLHLIEGDEDGALLAERLEGSLPAVSLCAQTAILTAFANDVEWDLAFAQQLLGLAKEGDTLVALSTSGNSRNCVLAATLAHELGVNVVSFTGESGGKLAVSADAPIRVPANETYLVQAYHLPVYHALCAMLEEELF